MSLSKGVKRKHVSLSLVDKVDLIRKLDNGWSAKKLSEQYGVGSSTIYDIKKSKEKILSFYAASDVPNEMAKRKTTHEGRSADVEKVLLEWFRQRRSEGVPISGPMLIEMAKVYHDELKIEVPCEYSQGWLHRFKIRHGIKKLAISGEKLSADEDAAEKFVEEFQELVTKEKLTPDQIYNADESGLFWRCLPKVTLANANETGAPGIKESKERLTFLSCANAAGTHKCKLLLIGKSKNPRALKGVKVCPVIYKANKRAWMTSDIMEEWFYQCFVKEARRHCDSVGLSHDCKIILLLDNCTAHPQTLTKDNVHVVFLPPNCTSIIQPMDQGIIRSIKCHYKKIFMKQLLESMNHGNVDIISFKREFSIRDAIWAIKRSWEEVLPSTLVNAWRNIWPATIFVDDNRDCDVEFSVFHISKQKLLIGELLEYAKTANSDVKFQEDDLQEWINIDDELPVVSCLSDSEIAESVLNNSEALESDDEDEDKTEQEKVTLEECITLSKKLIAALEKQSCVTEQEILQIYRIQDKLIKEKPKHMKQLKLTDMFTKSRPNP